MYDPHTVAFEVKSPFRGRPSNIWPKGYRETWFTIWHHDPERTGTGNRTDDSCGWFDRTPGQYADAVTYLLGDQSTVFEIERALRTMAPVTHHGKYTYPRLPLSEALALCLMIASELELRRWWNGQRGNGGAHASAWRRVFTRERIVMPVAVRLALNPLDNLSTPENPEQAVRLIAAALNRHFRPWYRHPRWHVHHWHIQWHWLQKFNRWAFARCAKCGGRFAWGESVCGSWGGKAIWHGSCDGSRAASSAPVATP